VSIQSTIENALNLLPGRRKSRPELTREQAMSARPIRNPSLKWRENDDGEAVIVLPRRTDWVGKALAWMFFVPEARPIALDDVGTFVWQNCDGGQAVSKLIDLLCAEYQLGKREAELSLTEFLKMLGKRGMIGFLIPKEVAAELGEADRQVLGLEEIGSTEEDIRRIQDSQDDLAEEGPGNPQNGADGAKGSDA